MWARAQGRESVHERPWLHVVRDKAHARSGAGVGRQTVAKKVLIWRAGFSFINGGGGGLWLSISLVKAYQHYPIWIFLFVLHLIVFSSKGSQTSLAS